MASGPGPKPKALKLIDGTRKSMINDHEPIPRQVPAECPAGVSKAVRDIWDYTVRELDFMGITTKADRDVLVCYCEAVVKHREASAILAKSPILITGTLGTPIRNPALAVQRDAANTIRVLAQEFGLTPSARTRIEVKDTFSGEENPFSGTG